MRARVNVTLAQQGTLFLFLYLGIFVASLLVGPLIDHLGNKANLLTSSLIVALAMVFFASAHSFVAASAAAILLGLGGGGLNTCTNVLVSDLYAGQRGPMLNLLGIFFGVGAISIPLMASSIEGHFTIPQLFLFCSVLAGLCVIWYATMSFPPPKTRQAFSFRELLEVAKYSGVLLLAFILFFESGNEACIAGWTSTYVDATGYSPRIATLVLATYWAAYAEPGARGKAAPRIWKSATCGHCSVSVPGRVRRPAFRAITDLVLRGHSVDRILLCADFSDDAGGCRRPPPGTCGNSVWIAVFSCTNRRHDVPLVRWADFTGNQRSCRHDRARAGSRWDY